MASTYLTRTTGTPTSRKKATFSLWVKRTKPSNSDNQDMICITTDTTKRVHIRFQGDDIDIINFDGTTNARLTTDRKFRDISAWYHIVLSVDTTQAISSNRVKLFVNGSQETSFSTEIYPALNFDFDLNFTNTQIGKSDTTAAYFHGVMSHVHYTDGYVYDASYFGSTDSVTGEWKINTSPSVTYGTNGFFILKDGNSVTDQSGNGNDFTVAGGTLTKTEDNPSNVFATANPLVVIGNTGQTYADGNLTFNASGNNWTATNSTIGASQGKWYAEFKVVTLASSTGYGNLGITGTENITNGNFISTEANSVGLGLDYRAGANVAVYSGGSYVQAAGADFAVNAIIGIAVDMDNKKFYLSHNGTYLTVGGSVGDPTSGSTGTGALTIPTGIETFLFAVGGYSTSFKGTCNFGNGYFGTTAVSTAGTNASGNGIFEFDCPTGYTALSTKGLNL